ncbi:MAG: hypothetical protein ACFNVR_05205 [Selenomonas noxia]|jgi:hypothetical protein|uniref:hypothetical protein n=1 Tax=Selenomonas noxia TaxID=135083 RepID=UPI0028D745B6|nr:hypothetical protein [Selenomonas noxia]
MKRWRGLAAGAVMLLVFAAPPAETAAQPDAAVTTEQQADAKAQRSADRAAAKAEKKAARAAKKAEEKREKKARYKTLFTDNGFTYYLDSKNSRWVPRPNSGSERMIEAWVRLVENTEGNTAEGGTDARPSKYFLEHYYISPQRREIMFISELEVTGRPENAIKERPYENANWEKLVPGSIEDDLFDAIVAKMKQAPGERSGVLSGTSGMSLRDMLEEFGRISL